MLERLTVIFEDATVIVDDTVMFNVSLDRPDDNWRVIQWFGTHGWIEVAQGDQIALESDNPYLDLLKTYEEQAVNKVAPPAVAKPAKSTKSTPKS